MTTETDRFRKNSERWSLFCPQAAALLPAFFESPAGEQKKFTAEEIDVWKKGLNFSLFDVLYVYGLTERLPYFALKEFCGDPNKTLVILEDDLEAIAKFLKSEEAEEVLHASNVWLFYLDPMRKSLGEFTRLFADSPFFVTTFYTEESKLKVVRELKSQIAFFENLYTSQFGEYANHSAPFYNNYYHNLFSLPGGYLANSLFGRFRDVPAIICGAGPSLGKNIETLKTLKEKALIFAGGSAMNALNGMGMMPHFGLGIDPNEDHISRIMANSAFEVPFLFRGRIHHKALDLVRSDKVYVTGSIGYNIASYMENAFGIVDKEIEEGCNVINFSLSLAAAMGCNPIVLVGVDLAYSDDQTYAPGMVIHPIHSRFRSKMYSEELIFRKDIHGNSVPTLWKWVTESFWFSTFAEQHPHIEIINSTEGGIGFAGIPNIPLDRVAAEKLTEPYPIECRLFGELQGAKIPERITPEKETEFLEGLSEHHEKTHAILEGHYAELLAMQKSLENDQPVPGLSSDYKASKNYLQEKLMGLIQDTESYKAVLDNFNYAFNLFSLKKYTRLEVDFSLLPPIERLKQLLQLEIDRTIFLLRTASANSLIIKKLLNERESRSLRSQVQEQLQDFQPLEKISPNNYTYHFENNRLQLIDPECDLFVSEEFVPEIPSGIVHLNDDEGNLKFESYRKEGKLHGPSRFYNKEGTLLAESWYLNGLQEGKAFRYHPLGSTYCIQGYKHGLRHGRQEYFYENHIVRMILNYHEGLLHGDVLIFHPNGRPARRVRFNMGKHDGEDLLWYPDGTQFVEAHFRDNRPVDIARSWHPNGNLALQIVYDAASEIASSSSWDEKGGILQSNTTNRDYFREVASGSQHLTATLAVLFKELRNLTPFLNEMQHGSGLQNSEVNNDVLAIAENLNLIGTAICDLEKLNRELIEEAGNSQSQSEEFWKTGALQKEIQEKLNLVTAQMQEELLQLRATLSTTIESLVKRGIEKDPRESGSESETTNKP